MIMVAVCVVGFA